MCNRCDAAADGPSNLDDPIVLQQWLDQDNAWFRETIRRYGWAIQAVHSDWPSSPSFAYTVGLTGFDHPEIVVFGLATVSSRRLLNELGEKVRTGSMLRDGDVIELPGLRVSLFDLPNPREILFAANLIYQVPPDRSVSAVQVVYPDDCGAWPWEPDYALLAGLQPMPGQFSARTGMA
jgi:hypothetical protein